MTISSSLNAGVAGLSANASRLAGIADNIANSATDGYRRVVTDFASLAVGDSPSQYVAGGVRTSSTRLIDEAGPLTSSANATDIAVSGRGFLPVTDRMPEGGTPRLQLTSTGAFRPDADGVLRDGNGQILLAWPAAADGSFPVVPRQSAAALVPVEINANFTAGTSTTEVDISANLPARQPSGALPTEPQTLTTDYYDALGGLNTLSLQFDPTGNPDQWTLTVRDGAQTDTAATPDPAGLAVGTYTLRFNDARAGGGTLQSVTGTPAYDGATGVTRITVAEGPIDLNIGRIGFPGGLTQLSDTFAPAATRLNGAPAGSVAAVEVLPDGTVQTISDSGFARPVYRIPLVDVANPNGLRSETGATFAVSSESGDFFLWDAGSGPTGTIEGFARLESATDVAGELTDLIQTQRAYSSNAKIIQTVDEMLQETTNIKR